LKADYQTQIGVPEAAMRILSETVTISDSPGMKTLRRKINERLEEPEEFP